jgi:hypothetical protein
MRRLIVGLVFLVVLVGVGRTFGATLLKSNTTTGYFDASSGTRSITFTEAELGSELYIADINVTIDFAKDGSDTFVPPEILPLELGDPNFNEMRFILTHPSGTSVTLIDFESFNDWEAPGGQYFFQGSITFDQSAALPVNFDPDHVTPGTFRPATNGGNLDSFLSENAIGTWSLLIADNDDDDGLSFYSYSIKLTTVPEPSSFVLASIGLLGLLAWGWRRKQ